MLKAPQSQNTIHKPQSTIHISKTPPILNPQMLTPECRQEYAHNGFTIVRSLFNQAEATKLLKHFLTLREKGFDTGENVDYLKETDPLRQWPRFIHPHRRDETSKRWLLEPRIREILRELFQAEPLAAQTMVYFKPPGARGHALHQDQYYLRVEPGTCMGVWLALERADPENGGMRVVPGFGALPLLCVQPADAAVSWSEVTCPLPAEAEAIELELDPGDTLFFNGWVPHGSLPNRSAGRFRPCVIGHYIPSTARRVSSWYLPLIDPEGNDAMREPSEAGGNCGVWTEAGTIEMVEPKSEQPAQQHE